MFSFGVKKCKLVKNRKMVNENNPMRSRYSRQTKCYSVVVPPMCPICTLPTVYNVRIYIICNHI